MSFAAPQVTSPSAERRVLVAEMMTALLNPASVQLLGAPAGLSALDTPRAALQGPLVDCATQSHALLTALHRLAEDRMEQVRAARCLALSRSAPLGGRPCAFGGVVAALCCF